MPLFYLHCIRCSAQYLQAVRVVISIYIKTEEFARAESLLEENDFPPRGNLICVDSVLVTSD